MLVSRELGRSRGVFRRRRRLGEPRLAQSCLAIPHLLCQRLMIPNLQVQWPLNNLQPAPLMTQMQRLFRHAPQTRKRRQALQLDPLPLLWLCQPLPPQPPHHLSHWPLMPPRLRRGMLQTPAARGTRMEAEAPAPQQLGAPLTPLRADLAMMVQLYAK